MKVSVITVCFNSVKTLEETISSVIKQSYDNIEYIIVDGKSTDGTIELIKKYQAFISKWTSEPDNGLYDAMNKGISMATGDVIALINSDDLFNDERAIEKVVGVFNEHQSLDSIYADLYYVDQFDIQKIVRTWKTGKKREFKYGWHPAHPTFYVKKNIYQKYGSFNLDFKLASDFEIMLRFLEKYKISTYYLPEALVKMRLGGATNKNLKNIWIGNKECQKAFQVNNIKNNKWLYPLYRILPKLIQYF